MTFKIVSGGQTGVDRAGLEAAIALGLPYGGWVPKGRRAEDVTLSQQFDTAGVEITREQIDANLQISLV